jgi:hypothetical protein
MVLVLGPEVFPGGALPEKLPEVAIEPLADWETMKALTKSAVNAIPWYLAAFFLAGTPRPLVSPTCLYRTLI